MKWRASRYQSAYLIFELPPLTDLPLLSIPFQNQMEETDGSWPGIVGGGGKLCGISTIIRRTPVSGRLALSGRAGTPRSPTLGGRPVLSASSGSGLAETSSVSPLSGRSLARGLGHDSRAKRAPLSPPLRVQLPLIAEQLLPVE